MFHLIPFSNSNLDQWNGGSRDIFRLFDEFEKSFFGGPLTNTRHLRTDILDQGDRFVLSAELPGFQKEDIDIRIDGDSLVISAEQKHENEQKDGDFLRRERHYGSFARSFDISSVRGDEIQAKYENGILTVELPKKEQNQLPPSRQIQIQ